MGPGRVSNPSPRHLKLRRFKPADAAPTYDVFFISVREGTGEYYNRFDREAWAGMPVPPSNWSDRLAGQDTRVAEMEGRIVGFMSLMPDGHLDLAFVLPNMMGTGVAARLYGLLEESAIDAGLTRLTTDASHLARSFFSKQGWSVLAPQIEKVNGREIQNFQMEKMLI